MTAFVVDNWVFFPHTSDISYVKSWIISLRIFLEGEIINILNIAIDTHQNLRKSHESDIAINIRLIIAQ